MNQRTSRHRHEEVRTLATWVLILLTLYVVIGSLIYPWWWYLFFWQQGYQQAHNYAAVVDEIRRIPLASAGVLILIAVCLFFLYRFSNPINRLIDRYRAPVSGACVLAIVIAALLVNAARHRGFQVHLLGRDSLSKAQDFANLVATILVGTNFSDH
jgi:formate hydrogenlyase subunit 3/multisubunit Na+/H+ antiporter MnhD subunit